jgi:hypothetical protein
MSLGTFHAYRDSVRWRLTPEGVEIEGVGGERTPEEPEIVDRAWELFGDDVNRAAEAEGIPSALILAAICTESAGGDPRAVYETPGYVSDERTPDRVCVGLMQTLLSTARHAVGKDVDREWLLQVENSIAAGTAYIREQSRDTQLDPPLVAAAWAAGGLRHDPSEKNRWRLRQGMMKDCFALGGYCDRFVRFFNDAVVLLVDAKKPPSVGIDRLLDGKYSA